MSRRRKSVPKVVVEVPVVPAVTVPADLSPAPVEVKAARPPVKCFRCGRPDDGILCRRCGVVLHGRPGETLLYSKPVNPMVGW